MLGRRRSPADADALLPDVGLAGVEWAILVASTVMSAIAGGLFVAQVVGTFSVAAAAAGVGWGAMIGIVDYSMLSTPRDRNLALRVGRFVPRAVLAFVAGALVAGAFLTTIYHREVSAQLDLDHQSALTQAKAEAEKANTTEVDNAKADLGRREKDLEGASTALGNARTENSTASDRFANETHGVKTGGTTGRSGYGAVAKQAEADLTGARGRLATSEANYNDAVKARDTAAQNVKDKTAVAESAVANAVKDRAQTVKEDTGPLARERALREVIKAHPSIRQQVWYLTVALILIDLAPALQALLSRRTQRDRALIAADNAAGEVAEELAKASVSSPEVKAAIARHGVEMARLIESQTDAEVKRKLDRIAAGSGSRRFRLRGARPTRRGLVTALSVVALLATSGATRLLLNSKSSSPKLPTQALALPVAEIAPAAGASEGCAKLAESDAVRRIIAAAQTALIDPRPAGSVFQKAASDIRGAAPGLGKAQPAALRASDALSRLGMRPADADAQQAAGDALSEFGNSLEPPCLN